MLRNHYKVVIILFLLILILYGCFPTYKVSPVSFDSLSHGKHLEIQAKLFSKNNNIVLFPNGFSIDEEFITGKGVVVEFGTNEHSSKDVKIPLDSILAMITYEETTSGARHFANFLLGLTGPPLTFLGVYCLACPKCCFGSCPTIYDVDGEGNELIAELFSESISKQLQTSDLDLFKQNITSETLRLKITNEALETHYIDKFELLFVDHPLGTKVFPDNNNKLAVIKSLTPLSKAETKAGENITSTLLLEDGEHYRSGVEKTAELKNGYSVDFVEITPATCSNNSKKMFIRYRNTLLSTTLLYDVVLGSQGIEGLSWTKKMNEDSIYASQFKTIYQTFSGIAVKVLIDGEWKIIGKLKDAGPLSWKEVVIDIPKEFNNSRIRLEFVPDNFMIDYVAFDTTSIGNKKTSTSIQYPNKITNANGESRNQIQEYLQQSDKSYLQTNPGDSYLLEYNVILSENKLHTAFIKSSGYYNEWIRGSWITNKKNLYTFDLYNINSTLEQLSNCWQENYEILESEFNNSRVILKGAK